MLNTNELLDSAFTSIPPRSYLYHLEPIGIGTHYVESLTSYVQRLALAHNVNPGVLISLEVAPLSKRNYDREIQRKSFSNIYGQTKHLNGISSETASLVKAVESLTLRVDLRFLTLLPWSEILAARGLLRAKKAWCPFCYEEWRTSKEVIYEPLLWSLSVAKFCPFHFQPLLEHCPQCNKLNQPLSRKSIPGYCSHCNQWLGTSKEREATLIYEITDDELKYEKWILHNVGELVSISSHLTLDLRKNWLAEKFSSYAKCVGSVAELARLAEMPKDKVHQWVTGKGLITINSLLLVCSFLGISISEFLTSKPSSIELFNSRGKQSSHSSKCSHSLETKHTLEQKQQILQDALDEYPPPSIKEITRRCGYAHESSFRRPKILDLYNAVIAHHKDYQKDQRLKEQKLVLKKFLESEDYPPLPMKRVAEQSGWTVQTLYKNFPELCQAISVRYETYQEMAGIRSMLRSRRQIWLIANEIHQEGIKPTDSQIAYRLTNGVIIRRKDILLAAKEARRRLGWE